MEIFLKVFLLIVIVDLSNGSKDLLRVEESGGKVPGYIRDLIKDFNKKDSNIHDVVIIDLENESSDFLLNLILMDIPEENPVIIPKVGTRLDDTRLRSASFVIITADLFNNIELFNKALRNFESNYYLNTAKFIFIGTKPMTDADYYQLSLLFNYIGVLNVVMLNQYYDELVIKTFNPYLKIEPIYSLQYSPDIDYVYPDKLTNLNGYTYTALAFPQMPRLYKLPNGDYRGIDVKFMQTIAKKQNANFNITIYVEIIDETKFLEICDRAMLKQSVDMTITTAIKTTNEYSLKILKSVNTFDVNGYCAFVPNPPRTSFLGQMLTPYDYYTWIVFIITIGTCVVIWKMFNLIGNGREDSALYFMYGIIAYFLLQSIPFRNNRIIQRTLLQICIFMMFILGNAYQSLIISLISESRYGAKIKTFDELMQSNYSLEVDFLFYYMMNRSDISKKVEIIEDLNFQQKAANNTAVVLRCDSTEYIMYSAEFNSHAIDYFYLLSDQIYTYYESFTTSKFSPYHEKLQYFSSLIFESGIRQHWKEFDKYEDIHEKIEINKINNEEYLINFDDLFGVFYLLGFGFICAILALILEIFWHDCLKHLNCQMIREFMMKKKDNKMKVRRIQVKPMQRIEEETTV